MLDALLVQAIYKKLEAKLGKNKVDQELLSGDATIQELIDSIETGGPKGSGAGYLDCAGGLRALCILSMVTYHADAMWVQRKHRHLLAFLLTAAFPRPRRCRLSPPPAFAAARKQAPPTTGPQTMHERASGSVVVRWWHAGTAPGRPT